MNAHEANKLAMENKHSETDRYLEEVFEAIKNRSEKGGFSMDWCGELNHDMKERLEQLGYAVEDDWHRNQVTYTIYWEEPKTN